MLHMFSWLMVERNSSYSLYFVNCVYQNTTQKMKIPIKLSVICSKEVNISDPLHYESASA